MHSCPSAAFHTSPLLGYTAIGSEVVIKGKNSPSPYRNEVSDAGFAYANQVCLAREDCRHMPSLSRELLTQATSMTDVGPVSLTASQTACIMRELSGFAFLQDRPDLWSQICITNFQTDAFSILGEVIFRQNSGLP